MRAAKPHARILTVSFVRTAEHGGSINHSADKSTVCSYKRASLVAQTVKNPPEMQEPQVQTVGQEDPVAGGNGIPLQDSFLENPRDGGAW